MTDSTLFPRCNPKEAPEGSGLVCGAVRPIVEGVHWDTTNCPLPEQPSNGCEQCPTNGGSGECPECPEPEPIAPVPDGCYTQVCFENNVPTYGQAPEPVIDFGQRQEWCSFGIKYTYEDGQITKEGAALPDGTYTSFTIQNGCVVGVGDAPLPIYKPSECCDDGEPNGNGFSCGDVADCLGFIPFAGNASPSVRFIGQDGRSYTIPPASIPDYELNCSDVAACLNSFSNAGTITELTELVGADGKKYFFPFQQPQEGVSFSSCGIEFIDGSLTSLPTTNPPVGNTVSEFGWPPVLGAQTSDWLHVSKSNCSLNFSIDKPLLKIDMLGLFGIAATVENGTRFLSSDGNSYSIEAISSKIDSILGLPALRARLTALENDFEEHKAMPISLAHSSTP